MFKIDEEAVLRDNMEIEGDASISTDEEASFKYDEEKWIRVKKIIEPQGNYHRMWHNIFLICCVVAIMLDPLFFYIPIIDKERKCIKMEKKLKKTTLVLRSFMDVTYVMHIVYQVLFGLVTESSEDSKRSVDDDSSRKNEFVRHALAVSRRIKWRYILIDILAILPIPQVVILVFFANMKVSRSLDRKEKLNGFVLSQYVPRIYRIFLSCQEYTTNLSPYGVTGSAWAKGLFNFFLYIIASHVAGAFWYFFSIQRETACWQYVCERRGGCNSITLSCDDINVDPILGSFLNDDCPVNPTNATLFDFGIFSSAIQSGIVDSPGLAPKFFYSFGWGLRNLSSFGSNLQTSTYIWENLFADSITITGLLLFIYLIGNLQTYLQLSAVRAEERNNMIKSKEVEIDSWIRSNELLSMKKDIMHYSRLKLNENKEVNLKNLLSILPLKSQRQMKRFLCFNILKNVPELKKLNDKLLLEIINNHLGAVIFEDQSEIIHEGKPFDRMLFFSQGSVYGYTNNPDNSVSAMTLAKGDFYGEELLNLVIEHKPTKKKFSLPKSTWSLKALSKVEAFALKVEDLNKFVTKYKKHLDIAPTALSIPKEGNNNGHFRRKSPLGCLPRGP